MNHVVLRDVLECTWRFVSIFPRFQHGAAIFSLRKHWTYKKNAHRGCVTLRYVLRQVQYTHCVSIGDRAPVSGKSANGKRQRAKNGETAKGNEIAALEVLHRENQGLGASGEG
ncbi:MAG: hypothetical protein L6R28_15880 [Planctomycetes bacterium]|nr:hypothetical protein [Planctomycetota bacterium]